MAAHGRPASVADLKAHAVIGFDGAMAKHRASTWLAEAAPEARSAARNASVLGALAAV